MVLYVFHFLTISLTVIFFHTNLLAYCSLVQVYNFLPGVLQQLFWPWLSLECDCLRLWIGVFYTDYRFKQVPLIQVTSGGQKSFLKKKFQVCESQKSCCFVGDQILIFHHNLQINSLKIIQCDFLDFFSHFVSHS